MRLWLHVENNRLDSELVRQVLLEHCPEVTLITADDGEQAIAAIRKHRSDLDLILMGLHFPNVDGIDVLRQIRQVTPAPLIVFSATENPSTISACYGAGAFSFVSKPSDLDGLTHTLKTIANFWCNVVTPLPSTGL